MANINKINVNGTLYNIVDSNAARENHSHSYASNLVLGSTGGTVNYAIFAHAPDVGLGNGNDVLLISNAGNFGGRCGGAWLVTISTRSGSGMTAVCLSVQDSGTVQFGYYKTNDQTYFGVYSDAYRGTLTVTSLSNSGYLTIENVSNDTTAPSGWTPIATEHFAGSSNFRGAATSLITASGVELY